DRLRVESSRTVERDSAQGAASPETRGARRESDCRTHLAASLPIDGSRFRHSVFCARQRGAAESIDRASGKSSTSARIYASGRNVPFAERNRAAERERKASRSRCASIAPIVAKAHARLRCGEAVRWRCFSTCLREGRIRLRVPTTTFVDTDNRGGGACGRSTTCCSIRRAVFGARGSGATATIPRGRSTSHVLGKLRACFANVRVRRAAAIGRVSLLFGA